MSLDESQKISILFVGNGALRGVQIPLHSEYRAIERSVAGAEFFDRFDLRPQFELRLEELVALVSACGPAIVHFSCHGTEHGELVLGTPERPEWVSAPQIVELLAPHANKILMVVLNACYSAPLARALSEHIPVVVGSRGALEDELATRFSSFFYAAVANGQSLSAAARQSTMLAPQEPIDQSLFMVQQHMDAQWSARRAPGDAPRFEGADHLPIQTPRDFVGRERELEQLHRCLSSSERVLLTGLLGVGKRTLIEHYIATRGRAQFVDGVRWLDAANYTFELTNLYQSLSGATGRPAIAQMREWLSWELHHRRLLLVIHNVSSGQELELLNPRGNCRCLVSSHDATLELDDAPRVQLGPWTTEQATDDLCRRVEGLDRDDAKVRALVQCVGRLPLGIKHIASYMRREAASVEELLVQLGPREPPPTLLYETIRKVYGPTYARLDEVEKRCLHVAAVAGSARASTILAIADTRRGVQKLLAEPPREQILHELRSEALLVARAADRGAGLVWSVPELLAIFLGSKRDESVLEAHTAYVFGQPKHPDIEVDEQTLALSRRIAGHARRLVNHDQLYELYSVTENRLTGLGRHREAAQFTRQLYELFEDPDYRASCLGNLGAYHQLIGNLSKAARYYDRALSRADNDGLRFYQMSNLGVCLMSEGELELAAARLWQVYRFDDRPQMLARHSGNIGECLRLMGELERARTKLEFACAHARERGDEPEQWRHECNLGLCLVDQGHHAQASELLVGLVAQLEREAALDTKLGAHAKLALAAARFGSGEVGEAYELGRTAHAVFLRLDARAFRRRTCELLQACCERLERFAEASKYATDIATIDQQLADERAREDSVVFD